MPVGRAAQFLFHRCGGLAAARFLHRKGLRILMYHRFADAKKLEIQCAHLQQGYNLVPMTEVADLLDAGRAFADNSVAVTVDDGYRDFLEVGFPLFLKYRIPVTVFLVTDFLDRRSPLWTDQVRYAFEQTNLPRVRLNLPTGDAREFVLDSGESRQQAILSVKENAKAAPNAARLNFLDGLAQSLKVDLPSQAPPPDAPLTWDEVRTLAKQGVEFGAHTRTHPILSRLENELALKEEIAGAGDRISKELGARVKHFCYPNGRSCDIGEAAVRCVENAGYRTAVTARSGLNHPGAQRMFLKRIGVDPGQPELYFRQLTAGFRV
jgi:peptidoglycan/xylan/chitin deacetylase (PgdA/CDA1 family)